MLAECPLAEGELASLRWGLLGPLDSLPKEGLVMDIMQRGAIGAGVADEPPRRSRKLSTCARLGLSAFGHAGIYHNGGLSDPERPL